MKNDPLFRALPDSFDERCPEPAAPERKPTSWGISLFAGIYLASIAGILMHVVPKFGEMFRQVKVALPGITCALLAISDAACAVPWLVYPALILLPATVGRLSRKAAARAEVAIIVGFAASVIWIVSALFLPLMSCHGGIGAKHP